MRRLSTTLVIAEMIAALAGCTSLSWSNAAEQGELLVQEGEVSLLEGEPSKVYYPVRYSSTPNLTVEFPNGKVRVKQQDADGFVIEAAQYNIYEPEVVKWQARGCVPKRPAAKKDKLILEQPGYEVSKPDK